MNPLVWVSLSAVTAVLAWVIARRRSPYLPVAWFLSLGFVADLARQIVQQYVLFPEYAKRGGAPATGWLRVAGHTEQALFLSWPASIAAISVWVFGRRKPWLVLGVYIAVEAALIMSYPAVRGSSLRYAYLGVEVASLCVAVGCMIPWARDSEQRGLQHLVVASIVVAELVMLPGPYRGNIFTDWDRAWAILLVEYLALITLQGAACLRMFSRR